VAAVALRFCFFVFFCDPVVCPKKFSLSFLLLSACTRFGRSSLLLSVFLSIFLLIRCCPDFFWLLHFLMQRLA